MFCPIFNDFGFCRAGEKRSTTFATSTELAGTGTYLSLVFFHGERHSDQSGFQGIDAIGFRVKSENS